MGKGKKTAEQILKEHLSAERAQSMLVLSNPWDPGSKFVKGKDLEELKNLKRAAIGIMMKRAKDRPADLPEVALGTSGEISS